MEKYFDVVEYSVKDAKKVLFFFPAGFTKIWQYRWTIFLLNRMGITVIGFDFAWKKAIRWLDFKMLLDLVFAVNQKVGEIIANNSENVEFSVLGLSMGSVLSLYTAKQNKRIKSIILFVPYGTLSNLLWTHKPSRPFIKTLMQKGLKSEQELEKLTQPVETQYEMGKLMNRKIVSYLGLNDKIVFDGTKLVDAIKKQGIDATFYDSRYGHFWTCIFGILHKGKWAHIL